MSRLSCGPSHKGEAGAKSEARDDQLIESRRGGAERGDAADDGHGNEAGDDGVFDGGGAAPVAGQSQRRSRSMGMSGRSAGGIG